MAWIKLSEELYLSDQSPYSLEKIDGIWYVVDNSTQKKSIPFTDIFNNPVFPVNLSNSDVLVNSLVSSTYVNATHLRGESANTPATPAHSFKTEISSGLYRESAGVLALSILGIKIAQFDSNGITANLPYWNIVDQKASGVEGGTFNNGAWRTRDLNTTRGTNSISGSSLASNQFTLPTGTYRIFATCPAYSVEQHQSKLRNITDSSDTIIGSSGYSVNTGTQQNSFINGIFTITSQKTFEIQHICSTSKSANGFGVQCSFSVSNIYTVVELWKIA